MASIPSKRINNNKWYKIHCNYCFHVNHDDIKSIIIGDSFVAGLTRYNNVWKNFLVADIDEINDLLSFKSSVNNFHFIDQSYRWTLNNGTLDF